MREFYRCVGCGRYLRKHEVKIRDWGHVKVSLCKACVEDYDRQVARTTERMMETSVTSEVVERLNAELRHYPHQRAYRTWRGNCIEPGSRFVSNGHLIFPKTAGVPDRVERLSEPNPRREYSAEDATRVWQEHKAVTRDVLTGYEIFQAHPYYRGDVTRLDGVQQRAFVHTFYLRTLQLVTEFDEIRVVCEPHASAFYRDGELVALLMPLREHKENDDGSDTTTS